MPIPAPLPADKTGPRAATRSLPLRRARAHRIIELMLTGMTQEQVGSLIGLHTESIRREQRWAEEHGVVEEVRKAFTDHLLKKSQRVYSDTLDLPAETDPKQAKILALKLAAARDIAQGTGALRKESVSAKFKQTTEAVPDLEQYLRQRSVVQQVEAELPEAPAPPPDGPPPPDEGVLVPYEAP